MKSPRTKPDHKKRKLISTNTKSALERKKKKGEPIGGRAPYGFSWGGGELIPELGEQRVIRRIRDLKNEGLSSRKITKILEDEGVVNRKGNRFQRTPVVRTLGGGDCKKLISIGKFSQEASNWTIVFGVHIGVHWCPNRWLIAVLFNNNSW